MKIVYVGLALLCTLTMACAITGNPTMDSQSKPVPQQIEQAPVGQISTLAPSANDHNAAVMSHAEADSLRVQGDRVMAQSGVNEIAVGSLGNDDLIYVLVVVLLVVLIIAIL